LDTHFTRNDLLKFHNAEVERWDPFGEPEPQWH